MNDGLPTHDYSVDVFGTYYLPTNIDFICFVTTEKIIEFHPKHTFNYECVQCLNKTTF